MTALALVLRRDGTILEGGASAADLLGVSRGELALGRTRLTDLVHPDDRSALRAALAATSGSDPVANGSAADPSTFRLARRGNGTVRVAAVWAPLEDGPAPDARLAAVLETLDADVGSPPTASLGLGVLLRALEDSTQVALLGVDEAERVIVFNRALAERTGRRAEDVLGARALPDLLTVEALATAHRTLLGPTPAAGTVARCELTFRDRVGDEVEIAMEVLSIRDPEGRRIGTLGVGVDVTHRRRLEAELRQIQRLGSLGTLAGGLAHDLNNFLTAILGYGSLALLKTPAEDPRHRLLAPLKECSQRAATLAHRMLSFSRQERGRRQVLGTHRLLENALALVRPSLPRGIRLAVESPDRAYTVLGDSTQLEQVLVNLCVNARDAIGAEGTISVRTTRTYVEEAVARRHPAARVGYHAVVEVEDTGSGIPPTILPRIFEPFFTTKGPTSGTGLGLANVAAIVRDHGGFVTVESEEGRGTTFRVLLPEAEPPSELTTGTEAELPLVAGTGLVLVVAHDPTVLDLAAQVLGHAGYRTMTALNAGEAIFVFGMNRREIDLVLLDEGIPAISGRECGAVLRAMNPDVRVLLLASQPVAEGDAVDPVLRGGAHATLGKPFDAQALTRAVAALLGGTDPATHAGERDGTP